MISSIAKNSWDWSFADFRDFTRGSHLKCSIKKGVLENFPIFSCNFVKKETLAPGFSCEFCKIFKNILFTEHLWLTASILQQLVALYFAITYSWQLSSSEKSLVGKKNSSIHLKVFADLDFFYTDFFFYFL